MGKFPGGRFQVIKEYFQQKYCRFCHNHFTADGIELLREDPGVVVIRVVCLSCGHPLGVAIVGTGPQIQSKSVKYPYDWTRRDFEKLAGKKAIDYDDLLDVHEFLSHLGADWSRHLPRSISRAK